MREEIRKILQGKQEEEAVSEQPKTVGTTFTYEQVQELLKIAANKMNPLEQRKLDEELARDRRRRIMETVYAQAEEQARWNKQQGCTHYRDDKGNAAPRGTGTPTTGGQLHSNETATLLCTRCGTEWHWKTTPQERDYFNSVGMMSLQPPPVERCLNKDSFVTSPPKPIDIEALLAQ